ncbi:MAG: Vitamin B12 dependent methionine synthase activation subunit [Clostridiales bacterium]|nr:Vitamin B12 dependent methionine synthase activation subunit [Clostridiales bacterium]
MKINMEETLRYLGCQGHTDDPELRKTIQECTEELLQEVTPRCLYQQVAVHFTGNGQLDLDDISVVSQDLSKHLAGCDRAFLFAATLGARVDICLQRCAVSSMSRAVVMQACAASLIESWCDENEPPLSNSAAQEGLYLRPRFSPGYGDFSIEHQNDLLTRLDCPRRLGLTMTSSFMLVPSKSVTAVIGLTKEKQSCHINRCMDCRAENCPFRKGEPS